LTDDVIFRFNSFIIGLKRAYLACSCGIKVYTSIIGICSNIYIFGYQSGKGGWAAPRLKDAALSDDKLRESYFEVQTK
jgi:hypothetical protein